MYIVDQKGECPICEESVSFQSEHDWLRDHFLCSGCGSIPRERALMDVIKTYYPHFRELSIHESSPGGRGVSPKLMRECPEYSASHYFPNLDPGEIDRSTGYQCQNLESLTFESNSFDLIVSQDVVEHIFDPAAAFREIARVLKPGGAHIFTVPIINKERATECWASLDEAGETVYHHEAEYHGNPVDDTGALVTMHWGYDITEFIQKNAQTPSTIVMIDNIEKGIRAEYNEVIISRKGREII